MSVDQKFPLPIHPGAPQASAVQLDVGVAGLGRLHQRPLIPDVAGDRAAGVLDAGLRPVGGVGVAADLHLQDLQVGAVAGLEQVVVDLLLLRGRVVGQQPGVAAPAADRPDPVERPAALGAVDGNAGARRGRGAAVAVVTATAPDAASSSVAPAVRGLRKMARHLMLASSSCLSWR